MKRTLFLSIVLATASLFFAPQQAQAQYVFGYDEVGYDSNARYVYGYAATYVDYYAGYYYDPAVKGELYWQYDNETPIAEGYAVGYSDPYYGILDPAQVFNYSFAHYRPSTAYAHASIHYVIPYYAYNYYYDYWYDPYGFSLWGFTVYDGYYGWPNYFYDPYNWVYGRRQYVGSLYVVIRTPADDPCSASAASDTVSPASPCPTPTPNPTPTPTPTPASVLSITVDNSSLRPVGTTGGNNTARVTARLTPAVAGRTITLRLSAPVPNFGGHIDAEHTGGAAARPLGRLRRMSDTTNAAGEFQTTFTPSHIANFTRITASSGGTEAHVDVFTGVLDVEELLPGQNYVLIGFDGVLAHPEGTNHWGTAAANTGLRQIANDYIAQYYPQQPGVQPTPLPDAVKLHYNDQSLPFGGKFETAAGWSARGAHHEHREGINCDVRCCRDPGNVPRERWTVLNRIFFERGSTDTHDETNTEIPHWHLRFEFGGTQSSVIRNTGNLVEESWWAALDRGATDTEWQGWSDRLEAAHGLGHAQMLAEARAFERALFQSVEYVNRQRSDEAYVTDLYETYLLREPDATGYNDWLRVLRDANARGENGREFLLQNFEGSQEFINLVGSLTSMEPSTPAPTPDPDPTPDPCDEGGYRRC
ncbi:MAG: DUF4214 domain-containing protein [Pyrinomonadaceae bacterium]